jgi:hypothetical protein
MTAQMPSAIMKGKDPIRKAYRAAAAQAPENTNVKTDDLSSNA